MKYKKFLLLALYVIMVLAGVITMKVIVKRTIGTPVEKTWSNEGLRYGRVAAFFPDTEGITSDTIKQYRGNLDSYLKEESVEIAPSARPYVDAYSAYGSAEIEPDRGGAATKVNVCAFGGDYFIFHPEPLIYGNYFSGDDDNKDKIVIDENAAWFLYGSNNICGRYAIIGGQVFLVTGVVKGQGVGKKNSTYGNRPRIYMSYSAYNTINPEEQISSYEVLFPDMVKNYAYKKIYQMVTGEDPNQAEDDENASDPYTNVKNMEVINFSTRYNYSSIFGVMKDYGIRSSKTNGIVYPYWENKCRRGEDYCVLVLLWIICWSIALLVRVVLLVKEYRLLITGCVEKVKIFSKEVFKSIIKK